MTRLTLAAAVLAFTAAAHADPPKIAVGEKFPNLVLPSLADGEPMAISDFAGQKVVLKIFASW